MIADQATAKGRAQEKAVATPWATVERVGAQRPEKYGDAQNDGEFQEETDDGGALELRPPEEKRYHAHAERAPQHEKLCAKSRPRRAIDLSQCDLKCVLDSSSVGSGRLRTKISSRRGFIKKLAPSHVLFLASTIIDRIEMDEERKRTSFHSVSPGMT